MRILFVAFALVLLGCDASNPTYTTTTLPSGKQVKVLGISTMSFTLFSTGATDNFLVLDYQTDLPMNDDDNLEKEADEIWLLFKPKAEKGNFKKALIRANEMPNKLWSFFGITLGEKYGSVYNKAENSLWSRYKKKTEH